MANLTEIGILRQQADDGHNFNHEDMSFVLDDLDAAIEENKLLREVVETGEIVCSGLFPHGRQYEGVKRLRAALAKLEESR